MMTAARTSMAITRLAQMARAVAPPRARTQRPRWTSSPFDKENFPSRNASRLVEGGLAHIIAARVSSSRRGDMLFCSRELGSCGPRGTSTKLKSAASSRTQGAGRRSRTTRPSRFRGMLRAARRGGEREDCSIRRCVSDRDETRSTSCSRALRSGTGAPPPSSHDERDGSSDRPTASVPVPSSARLRTVSPGTTSRGKRRRYGHSKRG